MKKGVENESQGGTKKRGSVVARERKSKVKSVGGLVLLTVLTLCFIGAVGSYAYNEVQKTKEMSEITSYIENNRLSVEEIRAQKEKLKELEKKSSEGIFGSITGGLGLGTASAANETARLNVLLMGLDTRDDDLTGRSDVLILFSLDQSNGNVDMVSIPRDTYVEIVGKGKKDKINHAYAFGGEEMTIKTVEEHLNIDIDHHVVFNFNGFMDIVDALGGVGIDVPFDFSEQDSTGKAGKMVFKKGLQTLDGEQALAYVRMRKQDPAGDVGRNERQKQVIQAVVKELKTIQSVGTYLDVYSAVNKSMSSDVGVTDIPLLIPKVNKVETFNSISMSGTGTYINGIYYMLPDKKNLAEVQDLLNTEVENGSTGTTSETP